MWEGRQRLLDGAERRTLHLPPDGAPRPTFNALEVPMKLRSLVLATAATLLWGPSAHAEELTPKRMAEIQHAEEAAIKKVQSEFGNRKSSELSTRERSDFIRKQNAALQKVHKELDVDVKTYARTMATQTRAEREAFAKEKQALVDSEKPKGSVEVIGTGTDQGVIEIGKDGASASESVIEIGKDAPPAGENTIDVTGDEPSGNIIEIPRD